MTWCKTGVYTMSSKPMRSSPPGRETATALTGFSVCPARLGFPSSLRVLPAMPSNNASETRTIRFFFIVWLLPNRWFLGNGAPIWRAALAAKRWTTRNNPVPRKPWTSLFTAYVGRFKVIGQLLAITSQGLISTALKAGGGDYRRTWRGHEGKVFGNVSQLAGRRCSGNNESF